MAKFRKKPVVIEAHRVSNLLGLLSEGWSSLPMWVRDAHIQGQLQFLEYGVLLRTPEGELLAPPDHWLIRGTNGVVEACHREVFAETYEHLDGREVAA